MSHIMFDLETWGTAPGSALRSIGAALFDLETGEVKATFYENIDDASCEAAGLTKDAGTARWWAGQAKEAQDALLEGQRPLLEVVARFHAWFNANKGRFVWCQGAGFDAPLWEAAAAAVGQRAPWKFWDVRDTRTAYDLAGIDTRNIKREGTYHNALDDSLHQIVCLSTAVKTLRGNMYP
jgi:hypothetical protein